jgi:hypothetical protein
LRTAGGAEVAAVAEVEVELLTSWLSKMLLLCVDQFARMASKAAATRSSISSGRDDRLMVGVPRLGVDRFMRGGAFLVAGAGERTDAESRLGSKATPTTSMLLPAFGRGCDLVLEMLRRFIFPAVATGIC